MKTLNLLLFALLVAMLGGFSISRIQAQTATPDMQSCPQAGMAGGQMMNQGMTLHGMHGPADQAYMQSMMAMHKQLRSQTMTGDADRDFMTMMIPHHQAAIDMASAELKYGKNPKLRAMAQQIITAQQREIDQMHAMLQ
jgi:uncharacterized protein (DUF305 family)